MTTRPHNEGDISHHFQIVCEVCGFQKHRPSKFVSKRLKDKTKTTDVLKFYRRNFVTIGSEQFSPLILLFVCALVDGDSIDLSANNVFLGEIYFRIVRRIYRTYLGDESYNAGEFVDVAKKIGKLAWKTLIEGRNLRQKSDIVCKIDEDAFKLSYLIGYEDDRLKCDETADIFVTFFHRTVEEFFASFHFVDRLSKGSTIEHLFGSGCKKPIFMINRLFLSFSLWFLYSDQQYVYLKDNKLAQTKLVSYVTEVVDVPQLHFAETTDNYLALNLSDAFNSNDLIAQCFWKHVLSYFQKPRQFLLDSTDPILWTIESLSHVLEKVFLVQIVGYKHHRFGLAVDMWRIPEVSSTEFSLVVPYREIQVHMKDVLPYFKKPSRMVSLYVVVTGMESEVDLSKLISSEIGKVQVMCDITNNCRIVTNHLTNPYPGLTHIHIRGLTIDDTLLSNFAKSNNMLPSLVGLIFELTRFFLMGKLSSLFTCTWPELTHLSLKSSFLNEADIRSLNTHDAVLPKLNSLELYLGEATDTLFDQNLSKSGELLDYYQYVERELDAPLFSLFKTKWTILTRLWLFDMNKREYQTIVNLLNSKSFPALIELGIVMWSYAEKQKMEEVIQSKAI